MRKINLELEFTGNNIPFIRTYQAVMLNKETGETEKMLMSISEKAAMHEAKIYEKIGYKFMYINRDIVFLE